MMSKLDKYFLQKILLKLEWAISNILFLIIYLVMVCCFPEGKQQDQKIYYIIQHGSRNLFLVDPSEPPPPPPIYYGYLNFIVLENSDIYFYNKHPNYKSCEERYDKIPPSIQLLPEDMIKIKLDSLSSFLTSTYSDLMVFDTLDSDNEKYFINHRKFLTSIASPCDTIKTEAIRIFIDFMKEKNFTRYFVRNWTEEEQMSLMAKEANNAYDPKKIKWTTKFDTLCK